MNRKGKKTSNHAALKANYPFLPPKTKRIKSFYSMIVPEAIYKASTKKSRALQNLVDYREYIKRK